MSLGKPSQLPVSEAASAATRAEVVFACSFLPTVVGVSLLFLFYWTAFFPLVIAGVLWLMLGGIWTFVNALAAVSGFVRAIRRGAEFKRAKDYYAWTILSSLASIVAAILCVHFGVLLALTPAVRLTVYNNTSVDIDRLAIHFSSGDVTVDHLRARESRGLPLVWARNNGWLEITVSSRGFSRQKMDQSHVDENAFRDGRFSVAVEPAELPKGLR